MKASVCITTFNEERTIGELLDSLLVQTKKADEIIVVDSDSQDQTASIVRYYQKKHKFIKLITERTNRAKGRNIAVKHANNDIIAITDAGCVAHEDWLEKIIEPFKDKNIEIVAGFYDMEITVPLKKAFSVFLGITPKNFDSSFMPSARSVAFTKAAWAKAGGFPENMDGAAEDTLFNANALRNGLHFFRVKKARVIWKMPDSIREYSEKIYNYAFGDMKSGVWNSAASGNTSVHNMRVLRKIALYICGIVLFSIGAFNAFYGRIFFLLFAVYILNAFRKVYVEYEDFRAGLWGVIVQFATDYFSIAGFVSGMFPEGHERRLKKSFLPR